MTTCVRDSRARDTAAPPPTTVWEGVALAVVLAAAVTAYGWDLDRQGWADAYYAAAAQAGAHTWKAFFFGSLEAGSVVSTDKPPAAIWLMAVSVRGFGLSSWSVLLPQLCESVATVLVLNRTVRWVAGPRAAVAASAVLASTPVCLVLARFDEPDALLTLLVTCAVYCTVRAARSEGLGWVVAAGALLGVAFLTKWLAAALPAPAVVLGLVRGRPAPIAEHRRRLLALVASSAAAGLWWVVVVLAVPAALRPYADSSGGSLFTLVVGRNGLSRLGSSRSGAPAAVRGTPGPLRLLEQPFSGQIGWFLPLAVGALAAAALLDRRARSRLGYLVFGGWLAVTAAVFSLMTGSMHPYYTELMAPPVAALAGMGVDDLWHGGRRHLAVVLTAVTAAYGAVVAASYPLLPGWTAATILGTALLGLVTYAGSLRRARQRLRATAVVVLAVSVMVGPTGFAVATVRRPVTGGDPLAGPRRETGVRPYPEALIHFLTTHRAGATWLAAVPTANPAARLQLQSGQPVLPLGGFTGHSTFPTPTALGRWVAGGRLRYVVLAGPYAGDPALHRERNPRFPAADVVAWARAHGVLERAPGTAIWVIDLDRRCRPGGSCT